LQKTSQGVGVLDAALQPSGDSEDAAAGKRELFQKIL
jgi:hypothetical protein